MKLYSVPLSPFAGRARMAVYAKGLTEIEIVAPPGGLKSPEYLAIHPMGKIPSLITDDGRVIPESDTIIEYLEDRFPDRTPLRPATPEGRADARLIARVGELYVLAPGAPLFGQLNPATRAAAVVEGALTALDEGLGHLNYFLGDGPFAVGDTLTTADCSLAPPLFFLSVFAQAFARPELLSAHPKVGAFWRHVQTHPAAARVLGEIGGALRERQAQAAG